MNRSGSSCSLLWLRLPGVETSRVPGLQVDHGEWNDEVLYSRDCERHDSARLQPREFDRVLHHSITINIRGNSYRLKDKLKAGLVRIEEPAVVN